ncbi:hypothetical protein SAY87_004643 [Trapa incisa]|uniref:Uncharacterized protein n=1 Tax=Trapa incisa TaxID=236973 RepID=A0AAN7JP52_9MYRT|nr:hypothetical protein SAY87_004643 [Trapa incisa]
MGGFNLRPLQSNFPHLQTSTSLHPHVDRSTTNVNLPFQNQQLHYAQFSYGIDGRPTAAMVMGIGRGPAKEE